MYLASLFTPGFSLVHMQNNTYDVFETPKYRYLYRFEQQQQKHRSIFHGHHHSTANVPGMG